MIFWKSYFDDVPVEIPSTYTDNEFKEIILKSLADVPTHFTAEDLITSIGNKIDLGGRTNGSIEFTGNEKDSINRFFWEQIWDRKIMIDLTSRKDSFSQMDKIQFIKVI